MPNPDLIVGAIPHERVMQSRSYLAESTIYKGDFVTKNANGTVARAAATNPLVGCALTNAAAGGEVLVADHPDQSFMIQADASAIDAQTDIGLNYDIIVGTANTTYMRSAMQLDDSTGGTTSTLVLRLLGISRAVGNALGANVKCVVKINQHQNSTNVAGV